MPTKLGKAYSVGSAKLWRCAPVYVEELLKGAILQELP